MTALPNPGSDEAIVAGCRCPVIDNAHGRGGIPDPHGGPPLFWVNEECAVHREWYASPPDRALLEDSAAAGGPPQEGA